uniref:Ovule protein n=1 Tax=Romanomermis culicivorax TaxID=13658 RepID=A0A915I0W6_ROMCU
KVNFLKIKKAEINQQKQQFYHFVINKVDYSRKAKRKWCGRYQLVIYRVLFAHCSLVPCSSL